MTDYIVIMIQTSYQEIKVKAQTEQEALNKVRHGLFSREDIIYDFGDISNKMEYEVIKRR